LNRINLIMAILTIKVQLEVEIEVPDRKVVSFIEEDMEDMVVNSIAINECRPNWDENMSVNCKSFTRIRSMLR
jgi:hypothetical protein